MQIELIRSGLQPLIITSVTRKHDAIITIQDYRNNLVGWIEIDGPIITITPLRETTLKLKSKDFLSED